jgi:hypothetical protein
VPLRNVEQNKGGKPSTEKDFETQHSGVFAPPGLPSPIFKCGIRVQSDETSEKYPLIESPRATAIVKHRSPLA